MSRLRDPDPSSVPPPVSVSDDLADRAVAMFAPISPEPLTRDDGREIVSNLARFTDLLMHWHRNPAPRPGGGDTRLGGSAPSTTEPRR